MQYADQGEEVASMVQQANNMTRMFGLISLVWLLTSCESVHPLVYNMSPCLIEVTYSAANIRDQTVDVPPGGEVGSTGIAAPDLENLVVVDGAGVRHAYSSETLASLRPLGSTVDLWAYFPDGLRFLKEEPPTGPSVKAADHGCGT